tara:strand:+ start:1527 stop:1904 length:378 start_codon:yes stop_codon:yes gene_type:complete
MPNYHLFFFLLYIQKQACRSIWVFLREVEFSIPNTVSATWETDPSNAPRSAKILFSGGRIITFILPQFLTTKSTLTRKATMDPVRILLVGNGGREHALAWKLSQSPRVESITAASYTINKRRDNY